MATHQSIKQESAICNFDFTIPEDSFTSVNDLCEQLREWAKKWAFQLEEGESGYRHYQGRLSLIKKKRPTTFRTSKNIQEAFPKAHWSPTCNTVHQGGDFNYVMKADTRIDGPWSDQGYEPPPPLTRQLKHMMDKVETSGLYPYQETLKELMSRKDDRCITYVVDLIGNTGKSSFSELMEYQGIGKALPVMMLMEDIMQCVMSMKKYPAYLVDMPRAMKKEKMYQFLSGLEELKNGRAYDKRYSFKDVRFDRPQIIVFSNNFPEFSCMSQDRWEIYVMQPDKSIVLLPVEDYEYYSKVTSLKFKYSVKRKKLWEEEAEKVFESGAMDNLSEVEAVRRLKQIMEPTPITESVVTTTLDYTTQPTEERAKKKPRVEPIEPVVDDEFSDIEPDNI